jgi:hypothetical protein
MGSGLWQMRSGYTDADSSTAVSGIFSGFTGGDLPLGVQWSPVAGRDEGCPVVGM